MKFARNIALISIAGILIARPAFANDPPALPAWIAEFSIVPLALLVFAWTGAAKLYDESSVKPGKRGWILFLASTLAFFSGIHEGFSILTTPLLGAYGVVVGFRMLNMSAIAPNNSAVRRATTLGGFVVIASALFLASFSFVFFGSSRYSHDYFVLSSFSKFHEYQRKYASNHEGKFQEFRLSERRDTADWIDSEASELAEWTDDIRRIELTYGPDLKSYQVKSRPLAFLPWPYRYFSPRHAYFMAEDGVIHVEAGYSASTEATAASPPISNPFK